MELFDEVGEILGITPERARQIEVAAIRACCRPPVRRKKLRDYLDD